MRLPRSLRNKIAFMQDNKQETATKRQDEEHSVRDPVCGIALGRKSAFEEAIYRRKACYFCVQTRNKAFKADPKLPLWHPAGANASGN